jgi:signal transduction histidine kinase
MVTTKGKQGTGLGLYMSYANIKGRFGGNIKFVSEIGEGTTFYVFIPYERPAVLPMG